MISLVALKLSAYKPDLRYFSGLSEGDIMFVAYNGDGDDGFAIVALVDIPANSTIYFNENEWNGSSIGSGGAFISSTEGEITWSTGSSEITAGTVVTFDEVDNAINANYGASVGTITGSFALGTSNEVIYAFVGTDDETPTTFLSAIANDEFNVTNGQLVNTGLAAGVDAVNIDGDEDVMAYTGSTVCNGTQAACAAQIANLTNWTTQDATGDQDQDSTVPDFPDDVPASFSGSAFVTVTPVGVSITASTDVFCNGESTGSVTATATPGEANYSYVWSTGATSGSTSSTTHSINSLPAGTYTVTVTDNNGTTATASATLTQPTVLGVSSSVDSNVSCNGASDGGATAAASGGTGTYTYSWNTGSTSTSITGVPAGTYTVSVTDANGCGPATSQVTITEPTALSVSTAVDNNVNCNGGSDGGATASGSGGTSPYTYFWNNGATNASITGAVAGTYTITVTDANGATATNTSTITEPTTLSASSVVDQNVSINGGSDGQATASATGGTGAYSYAWNNGATSSTISGAAAGTYTVSVTDANGCGPATSQVTITEPTALSVSTAVDNNVNCNGGSDGGATASGSGGTSPYTYFWNNGATNASITGAVAGTYTITVTDANGATATNTSTITEPTTLSASSVVDQNVSINGGSDGQATASATGGTGAYSYAWNNGATSSTISGAAAGTYTVSITDANGCGPATSQVTITEPTALSVSTAVDNNVNCNGGSDGGATASGSGGTSPYTYFWSNGATNATISGSVAGTYTVTVTDANGATATNTSTITEPTALAAASVVDSNVSINGGSDGGATASATGGTGAYSYAWSNGVTNATISGAAAGTYTVSITDANGCGPATSQVTITEPTVLSVSTAVDNNVNCNGGSDGGATASGSGGTSPYTYFWSNGATNATISGSVAGTYTVTVTDANGATATNTSTITEPTALAAASVVDSNVSINGGSDGGATASATGGTGAYSYAWSNGATNASITGAAAGTYTVSITDANGCGPATSQVTITEPTVLSVSTAVDNNVNCNGGSDGGATASGSGGTSPYTYFWSNGATNATISGSVAGTYTVTVTDANGATATNTSTITEPTALAAASVVDSNVSINGGSDGQATASATGGTGAYSYAWNNGATSSTISGAAAGTYTVSITDANGCGPATSQVTITEPTALSVSTAVDNNVNCNGGSDGGATASGSGGTSPYTYFWSNGATNATISGSVAGTYTVTVTDANGATATNTSTITEPTALAAASVVDSNVSINGGSDGGATASATGGTGAYSYAWSNGATNASITGAAAGTYTVSITDANGCGPATSQVTITEPVNTAPAFTSSAVTTVWDDETYIYEFKVLDDDCDPLTVTAPVLPSWLSFETNEAVVTTLAGNGSTGNQDGTGTAASFSFPLDVAVDDNLNVYVADFFNNTIRKITSAGVATTFAGSGSAGSLDGTGTGAEFNSPGGIVIGSDGNLYVSDGNGHTIRKVDTNGVVTTFAGSGTAGLTDGTGTAASFQNPGGLAFDSDGNLYIADQSNHLIRKVTPLGVVSTFAGSTEGSADGTGTSATFSFPSNIVIDDSNNLYVTGDGLVRKISPSAEVITFAGGGNGVGGINGTGTDASFSGVRGISLDDNGNLYVATARGLIRKIDPNAVVTTFAGSSSDFGLVDGIGTEAKFSNSPSGLAIDKNQVLYVADQNNSAIRKIAISEQRLSGDPANQIGTHNVTLEVSDGNGGTTQQSFTVAVSEGFSISPSVDSNVDCNGGSDGTISANATGGTSPYTYLWSNGGTSSSITGLSAGTYTVTATDNDGVTSTSSNTVTEPDVLVAAAVIDNNVSINSGSDGGATASATGGTSPYTYAWSNGAMNASITGAAAGTYTVSITDANGCGPATSQVTITEPAVLEATSVVDSNVSCNGDSDGGATASATGGTSPYTYSWSNAATNASITGAAAGTYTVTVTDNNGATSTSQSTITEPAALVAASVVDSNVSINGGSDGGATASATGGTGAYTYAWSNGATNASITGAAAGTYTVSITDANGCGPATSQVTITEPAVLEATSVVDSNVSCNGDSDGGATASATGGTSPYTYAWSNGATNASITGAAAGTYTVTITDNNGATATSQSSIIEPDALIATAVTNGNASLNGAQDGSATSSATGGTTPYTYAWSNAEVSSDITGLMAGTYTVTITDANGCTSTSSTIVTEPANQAPVITSSVTANFGENGSGTAYTVTATDVESNTITYSLGSGNDESLFDIASGVVTFKTSPDFENPTDGDANNTYVINVIASDGINSVNQDVTITVTNVDDTDPVFTSATTADFAENGTGTAYTVVATDANAITYSLGSGNDESLFDIASGVVTFKTAPDFENPTDGDANNTYVINVIASDGVNSVNQNVTITVTNVDDTDPVFTSATTADFAENGTGTAYTVTATDANAITYSLGSGNDESLFDMASGVVTFKTSPDFENPADGDANNTYVINVIASDGVNSVNQDVTITVTNVDDTDPVFTSVTTADFEENGTGTAYTVVATDANAITYSLGSGNDESLFDIASGVVTFKTAPDFENPADGDANNTYVINVIASDGINSVNQDVTITVTNVDDTDPVFTSATTADFAENGTGTAYTVVATDANAITYSLGSGNDEGLFDIASGLVTFKTSPDFENPADGDANNTYVINVIASDGINSVNQDVTITVTNVDDTDPVFTSATTADFAENGTGTAYTVVATDANAITYSLGSGNDESLFDMASGVVTFKTSPDFENPTDGDANNTYVINVIASDGVNSVNQDVTITVTNVDDTDPVFTSATTADFAENGTGTAYTVVATDANAITYSLGSGNDESLFDIASGVVTFKTSPDFENPADGDANNTYVINVIASDGINSVNQDVTITVTNVDDTDPVFTSATTADFAENGTGTAYIVVATDANAITYSLGSGNDEGLFDIVSRVVTFKTSPDFENPADGDANNTYVINVIASDGVNSVNQDVTITVTNVDDTDPVFTSATTADFAENGTGTAYTVVATDANAITYSLGSGNDEPLFDIASGVVTFKTSPDFENPADGDANNTYVINVIASDGVNSVNQDVTITVTNVDDTDPVFTSATTADFAENGTGTAYTVTATDANAITYSLGFGNDEGLFDIASGVVTFKTSPDFENPADGDANNSYVINVIASDGINSVNQDVTITVTDENEAATDMDLSNAAIIENNGIGDEVGTFTTTDEDSGDTHTYSLVSGTGDTDNASFEITGNQLLANEIFDFETKSSYMVRIRATDAGGLVYEEAFTITVDNEPESVLRLESTNPTDPTAVGQTTTIPVSIFNDGDASLTISSILYPEGFTGLVLLPAIEPMSSTELSVVFSPTEAKTYEGNLVFVYNGGTMELAISATGELVTSIDPGGVTEQDVKLYPNPSARYITLDLKAFNGMPVDISIVNEAGAGLHKAGEVKTSTHRVNVSNYGQGVYIVLIQSERELVRKKLIIRR